MKFSKTFFQASSPLNFFLPPKNCHHIKDKHNSGAFSWRMKLTGTKFTNCTEQRETVRLISLWCAGNLLHTLPILHSHYINHLIRVLSGSGDQGGILYHAKLAMTHISMASNAKIHKNNRLLCGENYEMRLLCLHTFRCKTVIDNVPVKYNR